MVGRWWVASLVVMAAWAQARPAEACSPPPNVGIYPDVVDGSLAGVPTDGVIAFGATVFGDLEESLALLTVEVTLEGAPVDGAIETVDGDGDEVIVVWRPAAPFAASADYVATITSTSPDGGIAEVMATLDVAIGDGPAGAPVAPELVEVSILGVPYDTGPRVCCDDGNSCGFPLCAAPQSADKPTIFGDLGEATDPMASQTYLRLRAGVDDGNEPVAVLGVASRVGAISVVHAFEAAAGNYCLALEAVSLVDGSVAPIVPSCVEHGQLELGEGPNEQFESFLEQCIADPYWEDTNEPYEPDGDDTDSGDDGDDADTGDDGDDAESGDDGDDAESGDDGDDAESGDDDGGQDESDAAGCGCTTDAPSRLSTLVLLAIGALGHRRRR